VALPSAHIHEVVFRSQGGSPFDPRNCICLCAGCHRIIHGQDSAGIAEVVRVEDPALGADGVVVFVARDKSEGHDAAE
jgi:hypothetical protein